MEEAARPAPTVSGVFGYRRHPWQLGVKPRSRGRTNNVRLFLDNPRNADEGGLVTAMPSFLDPKNDVVFKLLFTREKRLLHAMLERAQ